jgi:hypothetical protein
MGGAGRLLVELDALAAEIQELENAGVLTGYPEWRDDVKQAEKLFLETPDEVPGWLERMRTKRLSKQMKSLKVIELAEKLVKDAIIAVPPQTWNIDLADAQDPDKDPTDEELLVFRLGFIFLAYRIDYWYELACLARVAVRFLSFSLVWFAFLDVPGCLLS